MLPAIELATLLLLLLLLLLPRQPPRPFPYDFNFHSSLEDLVALCGLRAAAIAGTYAYGVTRYNLTCARSGCARWLAPLLAAGPAHVMTRARTHPHRGASAAWRLSAADRHPPLLLSPPRAGRTCGRAMCWVARAWRTQAARRGCTSTLPRGCPPLP
jgi:hypothetical protein